MNGFVVGHKRLKVEQKKDKNSVIPPSAAHPSAAYYATLQRCVTDTSPSPPPAPSRPLTSCPLLSLYLQVAGAPAQPGPRPPAGPGARPGASCGCHGPLPGAAHRPLPVVGASSTTRTRTTATTTTNKHAQATGEGGRGAGWGDGQRPTVKLPSARRPAPRWRLVFSIDPTSIRTATTTVIRVLYRGENQGRLQHQ